MSEPPFSDRRQAGERLAHALEHRRGPQTVVLAIPRGGVVVGAEIARHLECPLDVILAHKLGAPWQPELAIGAVVSGDDRPLLDEPTIRYLGVPEEYLTREIAAQREELARRMHLYHGDRPALAVAGRVVIVVDDGIATGATLRAALGSLSRQGPAALVAAVPVAPPFSAAQLRDMVDELICLIMPERFVAVGAWYEQFEQVTDAEVCALLEELAPSSRPWPPFDYPPTPPV
ncbi:MAG: phosphoribosyltransferase [Armatimonadetes bacterium]|nr:phosphoribosyltransferase [Armatimonadota bacterium]